jgi:hypothetical protein
MKEVLIEALRDPHRQVLQIWSGRREIRERSHTKSQSSVERSTKNGRSRNWRLGLLGPLADRCPPKASVKPAGAKSGEERVFKCNGLRGLRVRVNSYA